MRVAINGFGRIGRLVLRLMDRDKDIEIVAINDLTDAQQLAYLLKYDTNYRSYRKDEISFNEKEIIIGTKKVKVFAEKDPKNLPWRELNIDVVFECTGKFTEVEKANDHIKAGAKKVIISAPAKGECKTIVYNVNEKTLDGSEQIISAASCTTNCLAPVLKVINDNNKIIKGYMTTIHAYTNDQANLDVAHKKGISSRRGRASAANIVPTSTGAAKAIGLVIPDLNKKFQGTSLRVPVTTGSVIDLVLELENITTKEELNKLFQNNKNETITCTNDPIVSSDVVGELYGAVVDLECTSVLDVENKQLIKVLAWYDNEMGYSAQMVRTAKYLDKISKIEMI